MVPATLAHTRLAIIDLSAAGAQPMVSSGSPASAITFNGEIYNYRRLRADLASRTSFASTSDTEVLLQLCRTFGPVEACRRVRGMFAFAYLDEADGTLWLARDRFGEKPLYYTVVNGSIGFSSRIDALVTLGLSRKEIDLAAVDDVLRFQCVRGERSIYRSVHKVPPGCALEVRIGTSMDGSDVRMHRYWDPAEVARAATENRFDGTLDEAVDELDAILGKVVSRSTVSDVPVGAFLSGGIDSTSVLSQLMKVGASTPHTFTIGFGSDERSEAASARRIAAHLGTDHTELDIAAADALAVIPNLPTVYDEPFADASQIPTLIVSQLASSSVKVVLSGDGGDELFGGYPRYQTTAATWERIHRLPMGVRSRGSQLLASVPHSAWVRADDTMRRIRPSARPGDVGRKATKLSSALRAADIGDVYSAVTDQFWWLPEIDGLPSRREPPALAGLVGGEQLMVMDVASYLPDDLLVKVDRAGMAFSLETRMPLLSPELFEFAFRLPPQFKQQGENQKIVLRALLARHIPRELWDRPKQGFSVPLAAWLRGQLRAWADELIFQAPRAPEMQLVQDAVAPLWAAHLSGRQDWAGQLWSALMLLAWSNRG